MLSEIDALNSLVRGPVPGLSLSAGWSKAKGFELDIYLPVPTKLNLGSGITTGPFKLALVTKPMVELILSAGLEIPVAHSSEPLRFTLSLGADMLSAEATGQMNGWTTPKDLILHVAGKLTVRVGLERKCTRIRILMVFDREVLAPFWNTSDLGC